MKEKKEQTEKKKKEPMSKERKFYLFTAIGCAAALLAIIIVAVAVNNAYDAGEQGGTGGVPNQSEQNSGGSDIGDTDGDKPVVVVPEGMIAPIETVTVGCDYEFWHNQTLNTYHLHAGVDFTAEAGTEVLAVEDGVVESIYRDVLLLGTEIVVAHDDGLKSVYRFVDAAEDLKVGASVKKGDVIATVAEATGNEYKEGSHLHFEIYENGVRVDPTKYLTLEEK